MYLKKKTMNCTENYWDSIKRIREVLENADAIVIGAGAGLSTSAGLNYGGERFQRLFPDFIEQYQLTDMYSSAFYPFETREEFWAYFSKHIYYNRYESEVNSCYKDLLELVEDKNYFVLTTNADHQFIHNGFDKKRLFYTQGDYGLFQCSVPCRQETFDNRESIYNMVAQQQNFKIPTELIPMCPYCGKPIEVNLRKDSTFVEDKGWHEALERYEKFLAEYGQKNIVFLELGVGFNTPGIIKYPFWQLTYRNNKATFISINAKEIVCAKEIEKQSVLMEKDIYTVLRDLKEMDSETNGL